MTPREYLHSERRSYIAGSLVVTLMATAALGTLQYLMEPQVYASPLPRTSAELMSRLTQAAAQLTPSQSLVLNFVQFAGGVGLFFLNWRFSLLIRRPRAAFALDRPSWAPRLGWCAVLVATSLLFQMIVPQLAMTTLLARWGKQEIDRLPTGPPASAPVQENQDHET